MQTLKVLSLMHFKKMGRELYQSRIRSSKTLTQVIQVTLIEGQPNPEWFILVGLITSFEHKTYSCE
jgi:hypothetical protein